MSLTPGLSTRHQTNARGFTCVTGSGTIFNPSTTSLLAVEQLPSKEEDEDANKAQRGPGAAAAANPGLDPSPRASAAEQNDALALLGLACSRDPSENCSASTAAPAPVASRHASCASTSSSAPPVARAEDPRLIILENIGKFAETNTWHQEVDGVKLLTTTVNTVRRVALVSDKMEAVPPSMMRVEQSLLLHSTGATISSGAPHLKSNRPLYKNLEDEATVHELRADGTRGGATASADGVGCQQCFGETTFKFKFNITCARDVVGGDPHTLLRLRYSVVGHPEVFVDTIPFRLVAKEDPQRKRAEAGQTGRQVSNLPGLLKSLKETQRLLERELSAVPASDPNDTDGDVLGECQLVVAAMSQDMDKLTGQRMPRLEGRATSLPYAYGSVPYVAAEVAAAAAAGPSAAGPYVGQQQHEQQPPVMPPADAVAIPPAMPAAPMAIIPSAASAALVGRPAAPTSPLRPADPREPTSMQSMQSMQSDESVRLQLDQEQVNLQQEIEQLLPLLPELFAEWPSSAETSLLVKADDLIIIIDLLDGEHPGAATKRRRLAATDDDAPHFRSCGGSAPGDAADSAAPPMVRGLSDAPPPRPGSALAAASQQPPVLRLQKLLRGAASRQNNQGSRPDDSPSLDARAKLAAVVRHVLALKHLARGVARAAPSNGGSGVVAQFSHDGAGARNDLKDQHKLLDDLKASLDTRQSTDELAQLVCDE